MRVCYLRITSVPLSIDLQTHLLTYLGRAIAQAVSRRLPIEAARVRAQVRSCGICGRQRGSGGGFLRALRFPLPILIPPNAPYSSVIRGWYSRPDSGRRTEWTQSHSTPRNKKKVLAYLQLYKKKTNSNCLYSQGRMSEHL
jgi:hypothetical protein